MVLLCDDAFFIAWASLPLDKTAGLQRTLLLKNSESQHTLAGDVYLQPSISKVVSKFMVEPCSVLHNQGDTLI